MTIEELVYDWNTIEPSLKAPNRHIGIDDHQVSYLAAAHLIELGHTRIAQIGGSDVLGLNASVPSNRLSGFRYAMADAGLPVREDWIVDGRYDFGGGVEATTCVAPKGPSAAWATQPAAMKSAMAAARRKTEKTRRCDSARSRSRAASRVSCRVTVRWSASARRSSSRTRRSFMI